MKKVVALLMAAVMTVGMATVAFAAPSPAATTGTVSEATDKNGNKVEVTVSDNFTAAEQPAVNETRKMPLLYWKRLYLLLTQQITNLLQ